MRHQPYMQLSSFPPNVLSVETSAMSDFVAPLLLWPEASTVSISSAHSTQTLTSLSPLETTTNGEVRPDGPPDTSSIMSIFKSSSSFASTFSCNPERNPAFLLRHRLHRLINMQFLFVTLQKTNTTEQVLVFLSNNTVRSPTVNTVCLKRTNTQQV